MWLSSFVFWSFTREKSVPVEVVILSVPVFNADERSVLDLIFFILEAAVFPKRSGYRLIDFRGFKFLEVCDCCPWGDGHEGPSPLGWLGSRFI